MTTINAQLAIGYGNLAIGKTITTPNEQVGYEDSKLADARIVTAKHRGSAGAITNYDYDVDLGAAKSFEVIAILGNNLSDAATGRVYASNASNYSSPTLDPGAALIYDQTYPVLVADPQPHGRHFIRVFNTPTASRYVRARVTDASNADGYPEAGVYWVSPLWQPSNERGIDLDWQPGRPAYGVPGLERLYRKHRITIKGLTLADKVQLDSLWGANRRTGRLLFIARALSAVAWHTGEAIYCSFGGEPIPSLMAGGGGWWMVTLDLREVVD